ncbi:MAG: hypothetical protein HFI87_07470 [Bacilli bacterium]|nr:hypothetical protein [Bacilli bacterium]
MNKKNILISIFMVFNLLFCTSCDKKNANNDISNDKNDFKNSVESILAEVSSFDYDSNIGNYNEYFIENGYLYGTSIFKDISSYKFKYGSIIKQSNNKIYLSIENNEYCAIKDFDDSTISIYNINDWERCHKLYVDGDKINLSLISTYLSNGQLYDNSIISDDYIMISTLNNILDKRSYKYKWYRNNEEIPNSNVKTYTITSDFEDADYYVEIIAPNGDSYKSEPVNVKIDRR